MIIGETIEGIAEGIAQDGEIIRDLQETYNKNKFNEYNKNFVIEDIKKINLSRYINKHDLKTVHDKENNQGMFEDELIMLLQDYFYYFDFDITFNFINFPYKISLGIIINNHWNNRIADKLNNELHHRNKYNLAIEKIEMLDYLACKNDLINDLIYKHLKPKNCLETVIRDLWEEKKAMQEIYNLSEKRKKIIQELKQDLSIDEDHLWRSEKYQELADIEKKIHNLQEGGNNSNG